MQYIWPRSHALEVGCLCLPLVEQAKLIGGALYLERSNLAVSM